MADEGKDSSGNPTCDPAHFWDACAEHAGSTLAHEIGHNLGLGHPSPGTPEGDDPNNVAQPKPVSRDKSECEFYTERPSISAAQKECACEVIEECLQFEEKPCPDTRWDTIRCELMRIKETYDPLITENSALAQRLSDEILALNAEKLRLAGVVSMKQAEVASAKTALEEACSALDEFICGIEEELAEYKALEDKDKLSKEEKDRLKALKRKYKKLVKNINKDRGRDSEDFPDEGAGKDEITSTLENHADDNSNKNDDVYGEYRDLRDAKKAAESALEAAESALKEAQDELDKVENDIEEKCQERQDAEDKIKEAEAKKKEETDDAVDESGIEIY